MKCTTCSSQTKQTRKALSSACMLNSNKMQETQLQNFCNEQRAAALQLEQLGAAEQCSSDSMSKAQSSSSKERRTKSATTRLLPKTSHATP